MNELVQGSGKQVKADAEKQLGKINEVTNPAALPENQRPRRARVPMSEVRQRLQVPDIPGYRLYWFKDENVPAAVDAYYEHVKRDEISTNPVGIGGSGQESGTDLGSNVSIVAGSSAAGIPVRLNLMKLKLEYYQEDQKGIERRNSSVMEAIFGDEAVMFDKGGNMRAADPLTYRKTALFNRPVRKAQKPGQGSRELRARLEALEKKFESK